MKVPCILTAESVLMTPMQFGPAIRIPARRIFSSNRSSRFRPSGPVSAKPALITTTAETPFFDALIECRLDELGRDDDDRQFDGAVDVVQ